MWLLDLIESALATWRLTHMLMFERGPFEVFTKVRELSGIEHEPVQGFPISYAENEVAKAFSCFLCLSVWVAIVINANRFVRKVLATSALAIFMDRHYG